MNTKQKLVIDQLRSRTPDHVVRQVTTPQAVIATCTCGWQSAATRRQNAFARNSRLYAAERDHLQHVLLQHGRGDMTKSEEYVRVLAMFESAIERARKHIVSLPPAPSEDQGRERTRVLNAFNICLYELHALFPRERP